jgi:hypothetical protein
MDGKCIDNSGKPVQNHRLSIDRRKNGRLVGSDSKRTTQQPDVVINVFDESFAPE